LTLAPIALPQLARKSKQEKGPRAVGLVELSPDGKARLIPVAIMIDGKFYDAAAYKASPVPLAIWGDTVYEAMRTGVSQGLFTVREAVKTGNNNWFANGKWLPAGAKPVKKRTDTKPKLDEDSGPPKLRRPEKEQSTSPATSSTATPQPTPPSDSKTQPDSKAPTDTKDAKNPPDAKNQPAPASPPQSTQSSKPADDEDSAKPIAPGDSKSNDEDPNRPVLVRGKIETLGSTQHGASDKASAKRAQGGKTSTGPTKDSANPSDDKIAVKTSGPQLIPAVSDAGGPDPRPYAYDLKSDEEQMIREKMLAMAGDLITARAKPADEVVSPTAKSATRTGTARKTSAKPPQPKFEDVHFQAYDLWNTNEPVFILSASAQMPKRPGFPNEAGLDLTYYITLVTKQDIYGDLRKLNATVTDTRHLDETPRMQLIDAVDADGDGRGELLFREVSDAGSVYAIYRAGADQLFPLFEGVH
jgi:hypothetical protein